MNCYIANGTYNNIETTPMINVGCLQRSRKPYEPYTGGKPSPSPEYPQEIVNAGEGGSITVEVTGRNLLKPSLVPEVQGTYVGWKIKDNDDIVVISVIDKNPGEPPIAGAYVGLTGNGINADLSAAWNIANGEIKNKNVVSRLKFFTIYPPTVIQSVLDRYDIQVEYGTTASPYEPYTHQSLTLATPNGLPGIPVTKDGNYTDKDGQQWVCDEVDLGRGKYVQRTAEKEVSEITWSGAGTWGNTDDYKTLAFYAYIDSSNINESWEAVKNYGICNYATITSNVFNNSIIGFTLGDYIAFRVPRSLLPDWDENNASTEPWINWLRKQKEAGNPVIVRYALKTPIERDLTPEEIAAYKALRTYGPTTVITNDAGTGMEVAYVVER